ncbi:hypothetical protein KC19_VG126400 [Ceratodon purpureus]|uniref:Uncharacterized protein n=1 Tax=Ceratodon purpureus TaxID=3225 RepID=A0A8T0HPJ5_CERPU|nr:hypothetical protein KC19_VG126400 [Ceratodon purpureus]
MHLFVDDIHQLILHKGEIVVFINIKIRGFSGLHSPPLIHRQPHRPLEHVNLSIPQDDRHPFLHQVHLVVPGRENDHTRVVSDKTLCDPHLPNQVPIRPQLLQHQLRTHHLNRQRVTGRPRPQLIHFNEHRHPKIEVRCRHLCIPPKTPKHQTPAPTTRHYQRNPRNHNTLAIYTPRNHHTPHHSLFQQLLVPRRAPHNSPVGKLSQFEHNTNTDPITLSGKNIPRDSSKPLH